MKIALLERGAITATYTINRDKIFRRVDKRYIKSDLPELLTNYKLFYPQLEAEVLALKYAESSSNAMSLEADRTGLILLKENRNEAATKAQRRR